MDHSKDCWRYPAHHECAVKMIEELTNAKNGLVTLYNCLEEKFKLAQEVAVALNELTKKAPNRTVDHGAYDEEVYVINSVVNLALHAWRKANGR